MDERALLERSGGPVTGERITRDVRALGVREGDTVMFHTELSALGYVPGGPPTVIAALLEAVGEGGTLLAYTGWNDAPPYDLPSWPEEWREAVRAAHPAYDPVVSEADHANGRLPEALRHWPGARRSRHPDVSFAAVGARAAELTDGHAWDDPHGPGSPLARLVEQEGRVLLLGAPLDSLTLLHHAEALAEAPGKRHVRYEQPVLDPLSGQRVWRSFWDIDSEDGAFDYAALDAVAEGEWPFAVIARAMLAAGIGTRGTVGAGESHLFDAGDAVRFAVGWIEREFGA
ncbi:aminoglycoside 3-N-acetyltransferase [Streptomyces boncukensis]|uniref:Aminoglycoside 3-N-acetyltransferase n=1 Tax=Streptomyces boncukensis TaxID=2711219 RepID=A0A6G4WS75_9ACTN|nr:aminoglycoside 3-N-acetyltransferase [Streptomyces boncukensis]NGO67404.1 aminoglycoside 3-N-acetyltransferase [Streptomyces boncukensis]